MTQDDDMPGDTLAARMAAGSTADTPEDLGGGLPRVDITLEPDAIRDLGAAIRRRALPDTYNHFGELATVAKAPAAILPIDAAILRRLLAHHAYVYKMRAGRGENAEPKEVEASPSVQVCKDVLSERDWKGLPALSGIATSPVLRPDGTLMQAPGYDAPTTLYHAPRNAVPDVPERPTAEQVAAARQLVFTDVLGDFPWVEPADRANYIAIMVTPLLRRYIGGLIPLGAITAAGAETGKTLLAADIPDALYGATNRAWVDKDDEVRKAIGGILVSDDNPVICFDNVPETSTVDSPTLAKLLTSRNFDDRELGLSKSIKGINDRLWTITGNSMSFGGDIVSRTVLVRLDAKTANPGQRTGFKIPNLQDWLNRERNPENGAALLHALAVLVMDWQAAGGLHAHGITMRQFTGWASVVGGFLDHHGIPGLLDNRSALASTDDDAGNWLKFLHMWHQKHKSEWMLVDELCRSAEPESTGYGTYGDMDPWRGAFLTDRQGRRANSRSVGRQLSAHRNAIIGDDADGYRLEALYDNHSKQWRYRVRPMAVVKAEETAETEADAEAPAESPQPGALL